MAAEPPQATPGTSEVVLTGLFVAYVLGLAAFCIAFRTILFAWPAGIVTGNLLASAIWAPLAVIHLDRLARRHHQEHMSLVRKHHRELLRKIEHTGT
jgi:hypothetical protein